MTVREIFDLLHLPLHVPLCSLAFSKIQATTCQRFQLIQLSQPNPSSATSKAAIKRAKRHACMSTFEREQARRSQSPARAQFNHSSGLPKDRWLLRKKIMGVYEDNNMFHLDKFIADHVTHRPVTAAIKRVQCQIAFEHCRA